MWSDLLLALVGIALYIGPFVVLPFLIRREPAARRVAIAGLLVAPMIGAIIYLLFNQKFSIGNLVFATQSPSASKSDTYVPQAHDLPFGSWAIP